MDAGLTFHPNNSSNAFFSHLPLQYNIFMCHRSEVQDTYIAFTIPTTLTLLLNTCFTDVAIDALSCRYKWDVL